MLSTKDSLPSFSAQTLFCAVALQAVAASKPSAASKSDDDEHDWDPADPARPWSKLELSKLKDAVQVREASMRVAPYIKPAASLRSNPNPVQ